MWVRWIVLVVFVAVLGGVFVRLGEWQLHRLDHRRETNARIVAHQKEPVRDWTQVFTGPIADDQQWQRVTITGTYEQQHSLRVRYRNSGDQAGMEVVTPLVTASGRTVLIDRGFIPKPEDRPEADVPKAPVGTVTVVGWVRRSENGKTTATRPVEGNVRLINAPMIAETLGLRLEDGYIQQISSTPSDDKVLSPVPTPTLDEGPHFSYAIQWFVFTAIAVGGAALLIRGDLKDRRKRRERSRDAAGTV
ncbi:SURF1 family cytochrome oxidase biogenesis protein [Aestuariimicrobium sp. T2.26MG-19.2B]|uniref:SURF1 family cytochrome oxidase biogenesis protein n=1 Tax=Aestuariimicrobium sp. T2.26MG-19.2B TaxID=3040679 RepID=UPI0024776480|nr:SURF1 family protein [Aestuariimicrobium sp. T2.26MG-19.2B]CAI9399082.1 putative SURF1-like protein [Aestuariimicrobium sp. T2.26MG-19.2B]